MRNNVNFNMNANRYFENENEEVIVKNNIRNGNKITGYSSNRNITPNKNQVNFTNAVANFNNSRPIPGVNNVSNYVSTPNTNRSPLKVYIFGNNNNTRNQNSDSVNSHLQVNNFSSNLHTSTPKKSNKSFDYIKPPPIKKGMFSYPKSAFTTSPYRPASAVSNSIVSNSQSMFHNNPQLNSLLDNSQFHLVNSNSNLLDRENSSSNISIPRTFSMEKYQINKGGDSVSVNTTGLNLGFISHPNLNNKNANLVDTNDSLLINTTLKKNESTSSINLNKYKINLGGGGVINQPSNLNNNNNEQKLSENASVNMTPSPATNKEQEKSGNNGKILQTFSGINTMNKLGNNLNLLNIQTVKTEAVKSPSRRSISVQMSKHPSTDNIMGSPQRVRRNSLSNNANNFFANNQNHQTSSHINSNEKNGKVKSANEKESRRMLVELVKVKARKDIRSAESVLQEMNIDGSLILNSKLIKNKTSSTSVIQSKSKDNMNIPSIYNQLSGSLEIKNNNFEINNNFYGSLPNLSEKSANPLTMSKTLPQFLYHMDDESSEKTNLICYLSIPRILHMNLGSSVNSVSKNNHKIPFIFQLSPSNLTYTYGFEHYVFQWSDINSISPVGSIDILKIMSCSQNSSNNYILIIETSKEKSIPSIPSGSQPVNLMENNRYEIFTNSPDECKSYVNALNYLSQLVKCKAYSFKGSEKIKQKN